MSSPRTLEELLSYVQAYKAELEDEIHVLRERTFRLSDLETPGFRDLTWRITNLGGMVSALARVESLLEGMQAEKPDA